MEHSFFALLLFSATKCFFLDNISNMNRFTTQISARYLSRRSGAAYNALPKGTPNPLGLTRGRRATVIAQNLFNQLSKELHISATTRYVAEQPCPLGKAGAADNELLSFRIASPIVRRQNVLNIVREQVSLLYSLIVAFIS